MEQKKHVVVSGETLSMIAKKYGVTVSAICQANSFIKDRDYIRVGWELSIPVSNGSKSYYEELGRAFEAALRDVENLPNVDKLLSKMEGD